MTERRWWPSSLYTFPVGAWLGITVSRSSVGFPEFDHLHAGRFPPAARFSAEVRCSIQLSYGRLYVIELTCPHQSGRPDLNRRLLRPKRSALPG